MESESTGRFRPGDERRAPTRSLIATANQRVTHRFGGPTPAARLLLRKRSAKRPKGTRSERGWQTSQKLLIRAERKTVIARLRKKCDMRVKRSDPSREANASPKAMADLAEIGPGAKCCFAGVPEPCLANGTGGCRTNQAKRPHSTRHFRELNGRPCHQGRKTSLAVENGVGELAASRKRLRAKCQQSG